MTSEKAPHHSWSTTTVIMWVAAACLIGFVALAVSMKTTAQPDFKGRVKDAVDGHVLPRLKHVPTTAQTLSQNITTYCANGSPDTWTKTKSSFADTVTAWAAAQHLLFGPVSLEARAQRISFWPDPRAIVWRQLRPVLAKQDPALLKPQALAKQSVALQGLTALENLLAKPIPVGNSATPADTYKCNLATAIANNIITTSKSIVHEWTRTGGWRDLILNPGPDNKIYSSHKEAAAELVKSSLLGFQIIRDSQIEVLQKAVAGTEKLSRLPYHRSGLSKPYLQASIEASCEFIEKLNLTPLVPNDKKWVRNWLPNACQFLKDHTGELKIPQTSQELSAAIDKKDLRQLRFYANGIRQLIGRDIAPAAGLTLGFNELDGD